jgi:hypothetical protein
MSLYSKKQNFEIYPDTARTCIKWSDDENRVLMKQIYNGIRLEDIAQYHQRTFIAVKYHVMKNAFNIMKEKNISLEEISKLVNISVNDLKKYKQYQEEKRNKLSLHQIQKLELEILYKQKKLELEIKKLEMNKLELDLRKLELRKPY